MTSPGRRRISRALEALPESSYRSALTALYSWTQERAYVSVAEQTRLRRVRAAIEAWHAADMTARGKTRDRKR